MARKPPGVSFETWVDRQIREGLAKGAFDDLPRVPLDLSDEGGDDWWIKKKIRDEGLEVLPPSLVLRREVEQAVAEARAAATEDDARSRIEAVNERIRNANRIAIAGPPVTLVTYRVDEFLAQWRDDHPEAGVEAEPQVEPTPPAPVKPRWRLRR
ncbi:MAG: DUF1992 domain-containing protein [Aquihabitans sp.]